MAARDVLLSLDGVTIVYGSGEGAVTALEDVNLQTHAGDFGIILDSWQQSCT